MLPAKKYAWRDSVAITSTTSAEPQLFFVASAFVQLEEVDGFSNLSMVTTCKSTLCFFDRAEILDFRVAVSPKEFVESYTVVPVICIGSAA